MPVEQGPAPAGTPHHVLGAFEAVPAIIWAFEGPELRVVAANAGARASAGFRSGIVGRPVREVLPELEGQQIFEMMEEAYAAGRPVSAEDRRVLVDRNGDGQLEEGFFTYTFLPTRGADGAVRGLVVHIVETTARALRQAEAEHAAAASELRFRQASDVVLALQRSLLPDGVPVLPGLLAAASYRAAGDELAASGDWFDVLALPDGRVALMVGDVVGHGASAAGAMGQLRAVALDALAGGEDGAAALARVDRFAARGRWTRAATACLAVLDPRTGALEVAAHAHPAPLLVAPDGAVRAVEVRPAAPLGVGGPPAEWLRERMAPGEALVLFSDGLVERAGRSLHETVESLSATVSAARRDTGDAGLDATSLPRLPVERLATVIAERMAFLGEGYQDDVTLVLAQLRSPPPPLRSGHDAVPACLPRVRRELTAWLRQVGAGEEDVEALGYAATEAVTNAVQHAYGSAGPDGPADRRVQLDAELGADGAAVVTVTDAGRWRPPPPGPVPGGRGVLMMRALTDSTDIDHVPGGTRVRLVRRLSRPVTIGALSPGRTRAHADEALSVDVDEHAGLVRVRGPVDLSTAPDLRARVLQAGRGGTRPLCVDLGEVTVLSSAGVQLLHDLVAVVPELRLVARRGGVAAAVLQLTGLGARLLPDVADGHVEGEVVPGRNAAS
jgi:anti-anti-sigma factor